MQLRHLLLTAAAALTISATAANEDLFKRADAVTLLDSTHVEVQPSGSGTFNIVRSIKIQTQSAARANHCIIYDYDPLTAAARFKSAFIRHRDGQTTHIDLATAKDYVAPARSIFWGASQIMLEVGHLHVGDVLTYEIEKKGFTYALLTGSEESAAITTGIGGGALGTSATDDDERFVPPMRGEFYDIVPFWVDQPTRRKVYALSIPADKPLQYKLYQYDGRYTETKDTISGRLLLTITLANQVPFTKEPNMVDLYDAAPKLMLSTTPSWYEKSRWFNGVHEAYGSFKPTPDIRAKVASIIKGKRSEMEKISALVHWCGDNIRYLGLPMGKGEGYTCHAIDMDFTDRAGICKDIAGMLIGMLRVAGFEAYPAMTMAGSRVEQIPADHFNHCVCIVKLKNGTLMPLDPTWVPFCRELWSSAEQQQNYLPGIPEGSDLCITPTSAPENHYLRIKANNTLTPEGTLRGTFTVSAEGQTDKSIRSIFTMGWMCRWQQSLEAELLKVSPQARVTSVNYGKNPKNYQTGPIWIVFEYEIPDYAIGGPDAMAFKPLVMNNLYRSVQTFLSTGGDVSEHKYGFKDRCSRLVDFEETITLPEGMQWQNSAMKSSISNEAASIDASLAQTANKITLRLKAAFNKRVYEAQEWPGFKAVVDEFKKYQDYLYIK